MTFWDPCSGGTEGGRKPRSVLQVHWLLPACLWTPLISSCGGWLVNLGQPGQLQSGRRYSRRRPSTRPLSRHTCSTWWRLVHGLQVAIPVAHMRRARKLSDVRSRSAHPTTTTTTLLSQWLQSPSHNCTWHQESINSQTNKTASANPKNPRPVRQWREKIVNTHLVSATEI